MRTLAAELLKLRTVRVPLVLVGVTVIFSGVVAASLVQWAAEETRSAFGLAQAAGFWALLITVLGLLVVTNEYRHGTITTTFLAEPRRERVLAAKLVTALLAGAAAGLVALAVIAAIALPWLAARGTPLPLDGEALEAVGRLVLAFALSCAFGAGVGAIVQNQVGALVGIFVWFLIAENIVQAVASVAFGNAGEPDPVSRFLPGSALGGIVGGLGREFLLPAGWAALVAAGYVAALGLLGVLSMRRRDPSEG